MNIDDASASLRHELITADRVRFCTVNDVEDVGGSGIASGFYSALLRPTSFCITLCPRRCRFIANSRQTRGRVPGPFQLPARRRRGRSQDGARGIADYRPVDYWWSVVEFKCYHLRARGPRWNLRRERCQSRGRLD